MNNQARATAARQVAQRWSRRIAAETPLYRNELLEIYQELAPTGYLGSTIPTMAGGAGMMPADFGTMLEAVGDVFPLLAGHSVQRYIHAFGTEQQRDTWLQPLMTGHAIGAIAITEDSSGVDVRSTATRAEPESGGYCLSGQKAWVTHGSVADVVVVTAKTDEKSLSRFLVPTDSSGLQIQERETTGLRYLRFCDLSFERCWIPGSARLGPEGKGLSQTLSAFPIARAAACVQACAVAKRAIDKAIDFVCQTERFGEPLAAKQHLQMVIAESWSKVRAARALAHEAFSEINTDTTNAAVLAAAAKAHGTRTAIEVCTRLLDLIGSSGLCPGHTIERALRDIHMINVADAPGIINHLVVGRALLGQSAF